MQVLVEIVLAIFGEVLLAALFELLFRALCLVIGSAYAILESRIRLLSITAGAACGGASLLVFGHAVLPAPWMKLLNLLVTPLVCGCMMHGLGRLRARGDKAPLPVDRFLSGYLFALGFLLVRQFAAR